MWKGRKGASICEKGGRRECVREREGEREKLEKEEGFVNVHMRKRCTRKNRCDVYMYDEIHAHVYVHTYICIRKTEGVYTLSNIRITFC